MPERTFNILSIDGGGIKGLYSAKILDVFEKKYGPIIEHFDLICGTSTGGLIALGLAANKTANEIVNFYKLYGSSIFPSNNWLLRTYSCIRQFTLGKYSNQALKKYLIELLGNSTLNDVKDRVYLCIPSSNLTTSKGTIFKTPHCDEYTRDGKLKLVEVALATSAAPTYFPPYKIDDLKAYYADGGLWANNPSLIGAIEAVKCFVGDGKPYDSFNILSIGNLSSHRSWHPANPKNNSIIHWGKYIFGLSISTQSNAMDYLLQIASKNKLFPMGKYIRLPEPDISPNDGKYIDLDRAQEKSLELLECHGLETANNWINKQEIKEFFEKRSKYVGAI